MANISSNQAQSKQPTRQDAAGTVWIIQAISGLLLIFLLGLHMIAHHFVAEGGLRNFQDVIAYISNPIVFILEVLFLIVVTPHAMLGMQGIVMDLGPSEGATRIITWIFRILTLLIMAYGIWLAVALQGL
jgi:succinate dehydrogenase / fumarate reductase membrane anchor subunit